MSGIVGQNLGRGSGLVKKTAVAADSVTGASIADDAIDSEHYTDGSIDNAHIADDAIDSEHYAAASIDNAHLADDAIDSDELAAGAVDTAHIADNQVTLAKMAGLARGKLIYGDASGDPAALAVGSADEVLTHDGTDLAWAAAGGGMSVGDITGATAITIEPAQTDELVLSDGGSLARTDFSNIMLVPAIFLTRASNQAIANSTATKVDWTTTVKQQGGTWSTGDDRFTPGVAGYYQSQIMMRWNANIPESLQGGPQLYKNGSHVTTYGHIQNHRSTQTTQSGSDVMQTNPIYLDADDYLEMFVWHNAGAEATFGGGYNHWFIWRVPGLST